MFDVVMLFCFNYDCVRVHAFFFYFVLCVLRYVVVLRLFYIFGLMYDDVCAVRVGDIVSTYMVTYGMVNW